MKHRDRNHQHKPSPDMQRRERAFTLRDVDVVEDDTAVRFTGYAIVFDTLSENLGGQYEEIAPEAVDRALTEGHDVRFLINHEGLPLARTTSGTMTLAKDDNGLRVEATFDGSVHDVQRLASALRREDVTQMSFAFLPKARVRADRDGMKIWRVTDMDLYDVSVVGIPAYRETEAALRTLEEAQAAAEAVEGIAEEGSYEWVTRKVQDALPRNPGREYWVERTFPDFCVVCEWSPGTQEYWLVPYIIEDGAATLGEWIAAQKKLTFEPRSMPWLEDFYTRSQAPQGLDIREAPEGQGVDGDKGLDAQGRLRMLAMKADLAAIG